MTQRQRSALLRELVDVKHRLRRHGVEVAYNRNARSLSEHIADIKRRDVLEQLIVDADLKLIRSR